MWSQRVDKGNKMEEVKFGETWEDKYCQVEGQIILQLCVRKELGIRI